MQPKIFIFFSVMLFYSCFGKKAKLQLLQFNGAGLRNFGLISKQPGSNLSLGFDSILKAASTDSANFCETIRYLEKPFSDPNSSFRDEKIYSKLLQMKIFSEWFDQPEKTRAKLALKLLQQNQVGNPANDFRFMTPKGNWKGLYEIKTRFILFYFYNPECNACKLMQDALIHSMPIHDCILKDELSLVALYTDKGSEVWRKYLLELPVQWIHGRDENEFLYRNHVYDLKTIPSAYLLDRDKKIILKDCSSIDEIRQGLLTDAR
jgi:hypothetical protein